MSEECFGKVWKISGLWFAVGVKVDRDVHSVVYSMETSSAVCLPGIEPKKLVLAQD